MTGKTPTSGQSAGPQADLKKVKAAAASRTKKGTRNWKLQYAIWVGGSVGSVIVACLMLLLNPDRGPFQIPVNDAGLIAAVNRNRKTWTAAPSSFFEGWTIGDVKMLEGVSVSGMGGAVPPCQLPDVQVPESFDSRQKWPQCFSSPIYNMGNCTASWAITTASALSNRFCVQDPTKHADVMLSPQQLLSCDTTNRGCSGGDIDTVFNFMRSEGLVSEVCFPYQADSTVSCQSKCASEGPLKAASQCLLNNEAAIKKEIFTNGPVVAPVFLVDDFLVYREGIYQEMPTATQIVDQRKQRIIHAVKLIGWGTAGGKPYWIAENSWGEDWGEGGFARIFSGGEKGVVVDTYVLALTPASGKLDDPDDNDADFEDDNLDEDAEKPAGDAADDDDV